MDKQIIIDDVDVSGCLFYQVNFEEDYDVEIKHYCSNWHNSCESNNNTNCYYKQLKRKEQECNRYKQTLSEIQQDLEFATYCESQECGCDDANECLECTKKQILQKISEVEDANSK